jgi:hypothetical protein
LNFWVSAKKLDITRTTIRKKKPPKELKVDQDLLWDAGRAWPTRKKGKAYHQIIAEHFFVVWWIYRFTLCGRSTNDLLSKASSCHSSSAALSRDQIEHDQWDRNKVMGLQSKHFPNECDGDENKSKKKEDHPMVKYIKFQV